MIRIMIAIPKTLTNNNGNNDKHTDIDCNDKDAMVIIMSSINNAIIVNNHNKDNTSPDRNISNRQKKEKERKKLHPRFNPGKLVFISVSCLALSTHITKKSF